jgi:ferric-dicitrate binding protein FerR (iron transport regulator)
MSANTHNLAPWRLSRRATWSISASVLAAAATLLTVLLFLTLSSHQAQPRTPVDTVNAPTPANSPVYDCLPTRVIHPC